MPSNLTGSNSTAPLADTHYNFPALVFGILLIIFIICGNLLVCISVYTEKALKTTTNYFIFSLAVADLLLAVLVLPLFVYAQFQGGVWSLGTTVCDALMSMDVMLCTASIFNLCAISVDRFIAVSIPLAYSRKHVDQRQAVLLVGTWVLALAVASPVMFGINQVPDRNQDECKLEDNNYVIYSSVCSFFLPCPAMLFLYCGMFRGLRRWEEARKARLRTSLTQHHHHHHQTSQKLQEASSSFTPSMVVSLLRSPCCPSKEAKLHTLNTQHLNTEHRLTANMNSFLPETEHMLTYMNLHTSNADGTPAHANMHTHNSDDALKQMNSSNADRATTNLKLASSIEQRRTHINSNALQDHLVHSNSQPLNTEHKIAHSISLIASIEDNLTHSNSLQGVDSGPPRVGVPPDYTSKPLPSMDHPPVLAEAAPHLQSEPGSHMQPESAAPLPSIPVPHLQTMARPHRQSISDPHISNHTAQRVAEPQLPNYTSQSSRSDPHLQVNCMSQSGAEEGHLSNYTSRPVPGGHLPGLTPAPSPVLGLPTPSGKQGSSRGHRAKINRRERKAMRVLPVVVGAFLLCWTPFFIVHTLQAACETCDVPSALMSTVTWLGYVNSAINPVIYTIFNTEFRRFFRRFLPRLCC